MEVKILSVSLYANSLSEVYILVGSYSSTLPSSMKTNKILKSSLSKTSSLKKSSNYKFQTDENLQHIVKRKRENCLQVNPFKFKWRRENEMDIGSLMSKNCLLQTFRMASVWVRKTLEMLLKMKIWFLKSDENSQQKERHEKEKIKLFL